MQQFQTIKVAHPKRVINLLLADCPKTKKILVKRQRMWYN